MSKFLKQFTDHADYEEYIEGSPTYPNVSECLNQGDVHYNKKPDLIFYDKLIGDGVAYINTGFNPDKTHSYLIDFERKIAEGHHVFGATIGWASQLVIQRYNHNSYELRAWVNGSNKWTIFNSMTVESRIKVNFTPTTTQIYKNNTLIQSFGAYGTTTNITKTIHLFGANDNGTHSGNGLMNFYSFQIKDSTDTLLLNLRPCTYLDEPGMWDTVSNTFFGNANTSGTFTVAND